MATTIAADANSQYISSIIECIFTPNCAEFADPEYADLNFDLRVTAADIIASEGCVESLEPDSVHVDGVGGYGCVTVEAAASCCWTVLADIEPNFSVSGQHNGCGSGSVCVSVGETASQLAFSFVVAVIGGQVLSVDQDAFPTPPLPTPNISY